MTKAQEKERQEAIERLRDWVKPGDTVYTILRHMSRSGMQRVIDLVAMDRNEKDARPVLHLGFNAAKAMRDRYDREREGIVVGGCGMDMGFSVVYNLSSTLYPTYECLGDKCPSNHHQGHYETCPTCQGSSDVQNWLISFDDTKGEAYLRREFYGGECEACGNCGRIFVQAARGVGVIHKDGYALRQEWI